VRKSSSILLAIVLAGSSTAPRNLYDGPERPIGQLAVVRTWNQYVLVEKIDGKPSQDGRVSQAYAVPGDHVLRVKFIGGGGADFTSHSRPIFPDQNGSRPFLHGRRDAALPEQESAVQGRRQKHELRSGMPDSAAVRSKRHPWKELLTGGRERGRFLDPNGIIQ
jgi:hypothetical protein